MLTISGLSKSHGPKTLFVEGNLQINLQDKVGLVGANGAGKSTLFSIILGDQEPDAGTVQLQRGHSMGYLPQETAPTSQITVLETAIAISDDLQKLFIERHQHLQAAGSQAAYEESNFYAEFQQRFSELGGYELEGPAKSILGGLGFRPTDYLRPTTELSGGWVMRAFLARLLVMQPDLLLLDEPTNHLDLHSLIWFQAYLKKYPGGILLISHDREFLNQTCSHIVEIRNQKINRFTGNFDSYLVQRAAKDEQHRAAYEGQQKEIERLMEFVVRFRAKASKASQAQSKLKQIEKMEKIPPPEASESTIHFNFPQPQRSGQRVINMNKIRFGYGSNVVYHGDLEVEVERGARIVLVGPNGAGKSTLLKLMAGVLKPESGTTVLGHEVSPGYFAQYRMEGFDPKQTVLESILDTKSRITEQFARNVLGCFLFRGDDAFKKVSILSGGEKTRLRLVKLLVEPPNFLLMDEPTTHLDMASIDALVHALKQFQGTLVFISHDVYFINAIATNVWHVENGTVTKYPGNYQYYLDKSGASTAQSSVPAPLKSSQPTAAKPASPSQNSSASRKEQKRLEAIERQKKSDFTKTQRELVQKLENQIHSIESRIKEIYAAMEDPITCANQEKMKALKLELRQNETFLPSVQENWEAEAQKLEKMKEQIS